MLPSLCKTLNFEYNYDEGGCGSHAFHITIRKLCERNRWLSIDEKDRGCQDFYNSRESMGDLTIHSIDRSHPVHSLFLQIYGGTIFLKGTTECILKYTGSTIEIFLRFIYLGSQNILRDHEGKDDNLNFEIKEVLELAHIHQIPEFLRWVFSS